MENIVSASLLGDTQQKVLNAISAQNDTPLKYRSAIKSAIVPPSYTNNYNYS